MEIVKELHEMPIAIETTKANEQHYEVPAKFYTLCLGPNKKYSSGLWESFKSTKGGLFKEDGVWLNYYLSLQRSEEAMLDLYIERAQIKDGMIVRMNKNGTVKSVLGPYEVKHPKKAK